MENVSNNRESERRKGVWMRGLLMLVFLFLMNLAGTVLAVVAVVQFFWLLIKGEKNEGIIGFGNALSKWFRQVVSFQTMNTEIKPFPWAAWPSENDD
ncbi:MAG: DUF4389 domain-containing protein [Rhodobacteraceae bacterium]|nr:DUF4389 domain-containing protein [Paracoccaceae bacterium]